jgi:hypothetical protein
MTSPFRLLTATCSINVVIIFDPPWNGYSATGSGIMDVISCLLEITRARQKLFHIDHAIMLGGNINERRVGI